MRIGIICITLAFLGVGSGTALELMVNGDFEQELSVGWQQRITGQAAYIDRATTHHPDPDWEARCHRGTGTGEARLYQVVPVPNTDIDFTVTACIYAQATSTAWAAAAVSISYLDQYGFPLGETSIAVMSPYCPWANADDFHIIPAAYNLWETYAFNLNDELANLPAVDPAAVRAIQISLLTTTHDC